MIRLKSNNKLIKLNLKWNSHISVKMVLSDIRVLRRNPSQSQFQLYTGQLDSVSLTEPYLKIVFTIPRFLKYSSGKNNCKCIVCGSKIFCYSCLQPTFAATYGADKREHLSISPSRRFN